MARSRAELDEAIDALAEWMPSMLAETEESCQMGEFAARAEDIEEQAGAADLPYVHDRLQRILVEHCLVPSDEGPCG